VTLSDRENPRQSLNRLGDFTCRGIIGEHTACPEKSSEIAPFDAPAAHTRAFHFLARQLAPQKILRFPAAPACAIPSWFNRIRGQGRARSTTKTPKRSWSCQRLAVILKAKLQVGDMVFVIHKPAGSEQEVRAASRGPLLSSQRVREADPSRRRLKPRKPPANTRPGLDCGSEANMARCWPPYASWKRPTLSCIPMRLLLSPISN